MCCVWGQREGMTLGALLRPISRSLVSHSPRRNTELGLDFMACMAPGSYNQKRTLNDLYPNGCTSRVPLLCFMSPETDLLVYSLSGTSASFISEEGNFGLRASH